MIPIENDYSNVASFPKNIKEICAQMKCNELDTYEVMEGGVGKVHKISRSFVMEPVFKTNDAIMQSKQVYCPDRLSMVETDLIQHPKYNEVASHFEDIKAQVCLYASRVTKNRHFGPMKAKMTVLYSRPGGEEQILHKDDNSDRKDGNYVMSCIVALQDLTKLALATSLNSTSKDLCSYGKGSFIYFCGSQVHGGASYDEPNMRLHFYIHEDRNILNSIFDGNIVLLVYCKHPTCDFCCSSLEYLKEKHYPTCHKEWWKAHLNSNKLTPKGEGGKYKCSAIPPCEDFSCDTSNGIRKHYRQNHRAWWEHKKLTHNYIQKEHDGKYYCALDEDCEEGFATADELKDHYEKYHKRRWKQLVMPKGKKRKRSA